MLNIKIVKIERIKMIKKIKTDTGIEVIFEKPVHEMKVIRKRGFHMYWNI